MMTILIADFDNILDDALNGVTEAGAALGRMYRAALARAEAAEAEAARLRDGLAAMSERVTLAQRSASLAENALGTARSRWEEAERREKSIFDSAMGLADQRDSLAARVAELEAALGALDALAPDDELPNGAAVAGAMARGYILTAGCRDIHGKVAGVAAIERNNEMLRARVAELEAQLAAQGMRDDDDNPNS